MESQLPKMNVKTEMPEVKPAIATISPKDNNPNNKAFDVFEVKETTKAFEGVKCSGGAFHCLKDYWSIEFKEPIYTKEMHERGERPPVGSDVTLTYTDGLDSCGGVPEKRMAVATVLYLSNENLIVKIDGKERHFVEHFSLKPIPTIEEELVDIFEHKWNSKALAKCLLAKYNITPKGE